MLLVLSLSVGVPCVVILSFASLKRLPSFAPDIRGIALQTVIIMVVLLAVAGGVAAVLITRGEQAVDELDRQQLTRQPADFTSEVLCDAAGFTWVPAAGTVAAHCGP